MEMPSALQRTRKGNLEETWYRYKTLGKLESSFRSWSKYHKSH